MGGVGGGGVSRAPRGAPDPRLARPALTQDGAVGVHAHRRVVGAQTAAGRGRGVRGHPRRCPRVRGCPPRHGGCPPGWHLPLGALQRGAVVEEPGQEPLKLLHRRAPRGVQALPTQAAEVTCGHSRAQHPGAPTKTMTGTRGTPRDTSTGTRGTLWHTSRQPVHSQRHSVGTVVGVQRAPGGARWDPKGLPADPWWASNGHPTHIQ